MGSSGRRLLDQPTHSSVANSTASNVSIKYTERLAEAGVEPSVGSPTGGPSRRGGHPGGRRLRTSAAANQILRHLPRRGCRRCGRIVEIQKADATRLYGPEAIWRDVGQQLLNNTCTQRAGRHEEDGCWPTFDTC
jgi:hypothetical protein